jgi:alkanesulfonate monooxygenase SsuD/methylene tetrahydromethanopterin reductase-like flavin-dependent oxidoreductase (luciferase family)
VPAFELGLLTAGEPAVALALRAEPLGFDAVWLADAPARDAGVAVRLAAIAAGTARVRLGAALALAELDPLRVAEDTATLDGISGGRLELAAWDEAPAAADGHARLRERVALLRRLWTETGLSWTGRFRTPLASVTLEPRPVQQPHPPLWIVARSAAAADLADELALSLLLPDVPDPTARFAPLVERHRERAAEAGRLARVGACRTLPAGPTARAADELLAVRAALGLDLVLLVLDGDRLPESRLLDRLERFACDVVPALRAG